MRPRQIPSSARAHAVRRAGHRGRALYRRDLLRHVRAGLMAVGPRPAGPPLARSVPLAALMASPQGGDALNTLRHDLSNPLAAILAETQLLLLNAERFDEETVAGLKQIESLARKMRQILQAPPPAACARGT